MTSPGRPVSGVIRRTWAGGAAATVALALVASFAQPVWIDVVNQALIASIGAIGLNLVLGHTGLVSIGNAAFMAVGAIAAAQTMTLWGWGLAGSALVGAVLAGLLGLVVALPAARISGLYLAIATLSLQFIVVDWGLRSYQRGRVGEGGWSVPPAEVAGVSLDGLSDWTWFLGAITAGVVAGVTALVHSRPGRAWHAIRERPQVAEASGISVWPHKAWAFVIGSALAGLSGALLAGYVGSTGYASFPLSTAITALLMVILGGMGSTLGPVAGAFLVTALPRLITTFRSTVSGSPAAADADTFLLQGAIVGIAVVAVILFAPDGLAGLGRKATARWAR